uniref:G protein-coupled receptor n=1 Tax=Pristionchus pacificus TaxID=54126 RepID=A0A8R1UY10_PRIPA
MMSQTVRGIIEIKNSALFDLLIAANYLDMKELLIVCCRAVAMMFRQRLDTRRGAGDQWRTAWIDAACLYSTTCTSSTKNIFPLLDLPNEILSMILEQMHLVDRLGLQEAILDFTVLESIGAFRICEVEIVRGSSNPIEPSNPDKLVIGVSDSVEKSSCIAVLRKIATNCIVDSLKVTESHQSSNFEFTELLHLLKSIRARALIINGDHDRTKMDEVNDDTLDERIRDKECLRFPEAFGDGSFALGTEITGSMSNGSIPLRRFHVHVFGQARWFAVWAITTTAGSFVSNEQYSPHKECLLKESSSGETLDKTNLEHLQIQFLDGMVRECTSRNYFFIIGDNMLTTYHLASHQLQCEPCDLSIERQNEDGSLPDYFTEALSIRQIVETFPAAPLVFTLSLLINTATLMIIVRKSSALTPEIKTIAIFQQLSCLLSNATLTLLFIPFIYTRMGAGYLAQLFLTYSMVSSFGVMIIARHQLLILHNSIVKVTNFSSNCCPVHPVQVARARPQLVSILHVSKYALIVHLFVFIILFLFPFFHMLCIFVVLLVFIVFPFIPALVAFLRDDVYRDTQNAVCSTLLNSFVILSRNRNYRSAVIRRAVVDAHREIKLFMFDGLEWYCIAVRNGHRPCTSFLLLGIVSTRIESTDLLRILQACELRFLSLILSRFIRSCFCCSKTLRQWLQTWTAIMMIVHTVTMAVNVFGFAVFAVESDDASAIMDEPELRWLTDRGARIFIFGSFGAAQHFRYELYILGVSLLTNAPVPAIITIDAVMNLRTVKSAALSNRTLRTSQKLLKLFVLQFHAALISMVLPLFLMFFPMLVDMHEANVAVIFSLRLSVTIIQVFLGMSAIAGVALMIIARHQLLIMDDSIVKLSKRARYCAFLVTVCALHLETLSSVLSSNSNRARQNEVMNEYIQLSWRERGLNWYLFFGPDLSAIMLVSKYGSFVQVTVIFALILIPFAHMLYIVMRARKRMLSLRQQEKDVHIIHAQTIIIQFIVLILFIVFPFVPVVVSIFQDDVFRGMQTIVVIAEMVFVCSSLLNSFIIVWRNRNYRAAIVELLRFRTPVHRRSISTTNPKGC